MEALKQDMPPPGGYAPITYQYVPIKRVVGPYGKLAIAFGVWVTGLVVFRRHRDKLNNQRIEMRCAKLAVDPMLEAETDRLFLKQLRRNRDAEERIMKDVEGWEVGKWKNSRVYLTFGPDDFFKPIWNEYFVHTDGKHQQKAHSVLK